MKKTVYFAFFLMMTGILVSAIAYGGYEFTKPIIDANTADRIDESISLLYSADDGFKRNDKQEINKYQELSEDNITGVYEVLDDNGDIYAIIYNVNAQGRNGLVFALVAVDPFTNTVVGVTYYDHAETPNLGERYTRDEEIVKLIGQSIDDVTVDVIAGASTTWGAIDKMFNEIERHYIEQEVHIDG